MNKRPRGFPSKTKTPKQRSKTPRKARTGLEKKQKQLLLMNLLGAKLVTKPQQQQLSPAPGGNWPRDNNTVTTILVS